MTPTGMTPVVMLGMPVAEEIDARVRAAVRELTETHKLVPTLAIVLVGSNPASERYVKKKIEACARLQMRAEVKAFSPDIGADDLVGEVTRLSRSPDVHGILVQLPLPRHIEEHAAAATNPSKRPDFNAIII